MSGFSRKYIPGVYTSIKDEVNDQALIDAGVPEDKAASLRGTHWKLTLVILDNGTVVANSICEERPEKNALSTFVEGVEKTEFDKAYGGEATTLFTLFADNTYKIVSRTKDFGDTEWIEEYSKDGMVVKDADGKVVDKWTREISEVGWYKIVKEENFAAFNKAQGNPPEFEARAKQRKVWVNTTDKKMSWVEEIGPLTINSNFILGEEGDYVIPNSPERSRKILVTKTGDREYLVVAKGADGQGEEWVMAFTDGGMIYTGTEMKTGVTCKIWTELFDNSSGKYRMTACQLSDSFGEVMGVPAEMMEEMKNDFDSIMTVKEKEGGEMHIASDSKVIPVDMTYKFGEEYEQKMPGTEELVKVLETKEGRVITTTTKGSVTTISTFIFTNQFAVMETKIEGTKANSLVLYERI